ncbi:MAG: T9SS type A sorting domain-containing protein [Bacteroidales bacterium]|nr:T9SS type A sorting domain-containing protein [Bacteroidales bacterium]
MKKQILFLLLVLIAKFAICQTLVDTNKQWSTVIHRLPSWTIITETIKLEQDTVIDSNSYKKVFRSTDEFLTNWLEYCYIRETVEKKVYFRTDTSTQEYLLYDFGANVNDTVFVAGITSYGDNWYLRTIPFIVSKIDSILIGDKYRRQFNMNIICDSLNYEIYQWVEGVGSINGILHYTDGTVGDDSFELLCFSENDTVKYQNSSYSSCYYEWTSIKDISNNLNVSVYPNPVTSISILTIERHSQNEVLILEIYDITGRKIISERIERKFKINRAEFKSGLYLYKISGKSGLMEIGKIMMK